MDSFERFTLNHFLTINPPKKFRTMTDIYVSILNETCELKFRELYNKYHSSDLVQAMRMFEYDLRESFIEKI